MIAESRYCVPPLSVPNGTSDHAVDNNANRGSANTGQFETNLPIVALGFRAAIQTHGRRNSETTAVVPIFCAVHVPDSSIVNEKKHRAQSEQSVLAKNAAGRGLDGGAPATLIRTLNVPLIPVNDPMHSREPPSSGDPEQNVRPMRGVRMTERINVSIYCGTTYVHAGLFADCIARSFLVHIRNAHRVLPANVRTQCPSAAQGADSIALSCGSAAKNVNFSN